MKKIFVLAIASAVISCNQTQRPEENMPADSISQESQPVPEPLPDTTVAKFSDEENWLSGLLSDKEETRAAAFKKYTSIRDSSNGSVSEIMTGYIKTYFSTYPKEFLIRYTALKNSERAKVIDDIAREFRASGVNYKADLDQYFQGIKDSCTDCPGNLLTTLKAIKEKIESEVKKLNG